MTIGVVDEFELMAAALTAMALLPPIMIQLAINRNKRKDNFMVMMGVENNECNQRVN